MRPGLKVIPPLGLAVAPGRRAPGLRTRCRSVLACMRHPLINPHRKLLEVGGFVIAVSHNPSLGPRQLGRIPSLYQSAIPNHPRQHCAEDRTAAASAMIELRQSERYGVGFSRQLSTCEFCQPL